MRRRQVVVSPEAESDLLAIYEWIADAVGSQAAIGFIERLEGFCRGLDLASERGHLRDDIRPGLRILGLSGE